MISLSLAFVKRVGREMHSTPTLVKNIVRFESEAWSSKFYLHLAWSTEDPSFAHDPVDPSSHFIRNVRMDSPEVKLTLTGSHICTDTIVHSLSTLKTLHLFNHLWAPLHVYTLHFLRIMALYAR